ncbi:putative ribonuclease H-like domain-containing protein [Tanacetum coccineum]
MACSSSGSDTEVLVQKNAYTQALKKVEAQLVAHQQSQLWYEEKIRFMKIDLDDKTDVLTYHKKLLAEAEKEKEELKAKVEKWHNSSKNINILLNSQMSARDKAGLGYGDQMNKGVLSYGNEVFQSVFVSRTSDIEDSPVNDRYAEGYACGSPSNDRLRLPPSSLTYNKEIDYSEFTYGPEHSKPSESNARSSDFNYLLKTNLRHNFNKDRQTNLSCLLSEVNTVKPIVNNARPKAVSAVGGKRETIVKPQQVVIGDTKDITGTKSPNTMVDQVLEIVFPLKEPLSELSEGVLRQRNGGFASSSRSWLKLAKISEALEDESWVDAMEEELLQFKIRKGHRQEEGIDYDEVFAHVARIEAISIFLAFASYMGFIVYQMDVKSAFLYGKINDEKFDFASVKTASTPIETQKPLVKDEEASDVDISKGKPKTGLMVSYSGPSFDLEAYSDSDYARANLDRKSTTGEGSGGNHGEIVEETVRMQKESVSKQGRKPAKAKPTVHKDLAFDELDDDTMDYIETEDAQDVGRISYVVHEEKESVEKGVSTKDPLSTAQPKVSTDKPEDSTDKPDEGTDKPKVSTDKEEVSTDRPDEGTVDQNRGRSATQTASTTTTQTIFSDDETIAQVLIIMFQNKEKLKEKQKGVEFKDVKETERPRPTSTRSLLTLKPLPKIDPKDKSKKMIEEEDESDTDSEDITEAEKKFKQLVRDEEVAKKVQEDWDAEEEARLNADKILAEKLQEEEREMYTIERRAKFIHETIAAQRRFLAQQRSEAIRNKPPSRNQLRNQMMTYLKHVGVKKHSDLNTKGFKEIKALYDKIKRSDDSFIAIGSAEDEKVIKEMNEQVADTSKKRVKKDDNIKGEIKEEEGTRKRKLGIRKKLKSKKRKFTSEDDEESEYLTTKPQYDETEEIEDVYLNVVIRSIRQRRYFSTLMAVLSILDRDDIFAIYQLDEAVLRSHNGRN